MADSNRVVWLTEIISPYRIPVFNEVARRLGKQFVVLFFARTEKRRSWKVYTERIEFEYEILPSLLLQRSPSSTPYFFNPTIWWALRKYRAKTIIIGGYHHPTSLLALLYARLFQRNVILWSESTLHDQRSAPSLKDRYKRQFIRMCDRYIVSGQAARAYLLAYGASPDKIYHAANVVDNEFFQTRLPSRNTDCGNGLDNKKTILYVGRVIEEKGVLDLIQAYEQIAPKVNARLLIVGDGKDKTRYEEYCRSKNLAQIHFEGFVHQENLPIYYEQANVFVLPTHSDPWGLVVNEAMACGLPVICSNVAGAAPDLVSHGQNGYIFQKQDIAQLAYYLQHILLNDHLANQMGQASSAIIQNYTPALCAAGIIDSLSF